MKLYNHSDCVYYLEEYSEGCCNKKISRGSCKIKDDGIFRGCNLAAGYCKYQKKEEKEDVHST